VATEPFDVWLPVGLRPPAELHVGVRRFPRRRLAAYWNGCTMRW
jgi:hypothetical protein